MKVIDKQVLGGVVFWRADDTDRAKLEAAMEPLGLGEFVPKDRSNRASLFTALYELYGDAKTLVRPLGKKIPNGGAFTVVKEERGVDENQYPQLLSAEVDANGVLTVTPHDDRYCQVSAAFERFQNVLPAATVGTMLVNILAKRFRGVPLRPGGAIYWIPADYIERWTKVAEAVEASPIMAGCTAVYLMQTTMDDQTMRAVRDGILADIEAVVDELGKQVQDPELGEKALEARVAEAVDLRKRLEEYEQIVGPFAAALHDAIKAVEFSGARAAVLASSKSWGASNGTAAHSAAA